MCEYIINKLVTYAKNDKRYKFKILNRIRNIILNFYNPIIKVPVGNKLLYMNFSHQLPIYLAQNLLYDTALPRLIKLVNAKNIIDTVTLIKSININVKILCVEGNSEYSSLLRKNYVHDNSVIIEEIFCSDISETRNIELDTKK